jgi:Ca2+-binding EF-hand superfamily protein
MARKVLRTIAVNSQVVKEFGYQLSKKELTVILNDLSAYKYYDVPMEKFVRMCEAPSVGVFYNKEIMRAGYSSDKISD